MDSSSLLDVVRDAFAALLPKDPPPGTMLYARFFPPSFVEETLGHQRILIAKWDVHVVSERLDSSLGVVVRADRAVEVRENKNESSLLLVDTLAVGAGMDGIYSAAREIGEEEFYAVAHDLALKRLGKSQDVARYAVSQAGKLGATVSPFRALQFYVEASHRMDGFGRALGLLGIWPLALDALPTREDIDRGVRLTEYLLLDVRGQQNAAARVESLGLYDPQPDQLNALIEIARESDRKLFRDITETVMEHPELWLGRIHVRIFDKRLLSIHLVPWRAKSGGKLASWSGLQEFEGRPTFIVDQSDRATNTHMEVRWNVTPDDLIAGSLEYVVEVVAGEDVLAVRRVPHVKRPLQKCLLSAEDFDIEPGSKFEAIVRVHSDSVEEQMKEDFIVMTGDAKEPPQARKNRRERTLVDGLVVLEEDAYRSIVGAYGDSASYEAGKDSVSVRSPSNQTVVVSVPALLKAIEDDWKLQRNGVGYWTLTTFADGRLASPPTFVSIAASDMGSAAQRVIQATQQLANRIQQGPGVLAWVNHDETAADCLNAWIQGLDGGGVPRLARAFTVEVQDLGQKPIGLIVLPFHPIRVAWQAAYDALVEHERYRNGISQRQLKNAVNTLDGAYFPMFLPKSGDAKDVWVYGEMLDFHTVAMVTAADPEPKSSIARMAKAWFGPTIVPSNHQSISQTLRKEVDRFRQLHVDYDGLHIHGVKVGDGAAVIEALGPDMSKENADEDPDRSRYELELYPANPHDEMVGAKIAEVMRQHRTRGSVPESLRWILDSSSVGSGRLVPRFQWRRKLEPIPRDAAHLSIAFNLFDSGIRLVPRQTIPESSYLIYGLVQSLHRHMIGGDHPRWQLTVPVAYDGRKHPVSGRLTDRLAKIQFLLTGMTVRGLGKAPEEFWPILETFLGDDNRRTVEALHRLSDWVITFDRNIGFEYFDNPRDYREIYDIYIIDCVPERGDFNSLQMVTSTTHVDEVLFLLNEMIDEMGLSKSVRNGRQVLSLLKMVSGRLAMRLSGRGTTAQEAVGLAMLLDHCLAEVQGPWLSLKEGFLVPLDELPEFFGQSTPRSDFIYVTSPKRGDLEFHFVEVKFRRYRVTARSAEVISEVEYQLAETRKKWDELFAASQPPLQAAVSRIRLAQVFRFYLDKAHRHQLSNEMYNKIVRELNALLREPDYQLSKPNWDRGYVFCPEFLGGKPSPLTPNNTVWLFGGNRGGDSQEQRNKDSAVLVPDDRNPPAVESLTTGASERLRKTSRGAVDHHLASGDTSPESAIPGLDDERPIHIGKDQYDRPVQWQLSVRGNPHLLVLGLPGMGKTTSLMNIARQLGNKGVLPVIFCYHEDIDDKAIEIWGDRVTFIDFSAIGFNPMEVESDNPYGYIDNAGTLRDIFAAIFPDLGDIQLATIREALLAAYRDYGWSASSRGAIPPFRAFWETLEGSKSDPKLLARLRELDDYGVFRSENSGPSLLNITQPLVIRLHTTQNETVQRAFAMFLLYRIYQDMFKHGIQDNITHAIVFDEAHRSSKLKLMARVAKECRKYGLAMILASQEVKDFDESLVQAIGSFLTLRVGESDSKVMARHTAPADHAKTLSDALKVLPKFQGYFFTEGYKEGRRVFLTSPSE